MKKNVLKEFTQGDFSLAELDSIQDLTKKRLYCRKYLDYEIGIGSSRATFEIGDGEVLKLASSSNPRVGIKQNKQEYLNYKTTKNKYPELNELFPKVFQIAKDGVWLTCERVLPLGYNTEETKVEEIVDDNTDCEKVLGIPLYKLNKPSLIGFVDWCENNFELDEEDKHHAVIYKFLLETNKWFQLLLQYIQLNGNRTDLHDENFGFTLRNGKPIVVILDTGCEHINEHFNKIDNIITESIDSFLNNNVYTNGKFTI